mgnify:CR=1 FL=1
MVCGTLVVIEERHWLTGVAKLEDPRAAQLAEYVPPDFRVSRSLARSLATYVERRRFFTQARRGEVAKHLAQPLLAQFAGGQRGHEVRDRKAAGQHRRTRRQRLLGLSALQMLGQRLARSAQVEQRIACATLAWLKSSGIRDRLRRQQKDRDS